ncbi:class I SAM-dependent methyltransferase [Nocardia yamanashiensis]|uniref:class I SAM-dependent methyltransferase n=1 Tax=Nocardia yamanashiensis TaxID=209247 RepID=UPI001E5052A4|nr:class I SAM-dependent methyltransferase [Nocardia yamanashiensis]UGT40202.1 class I SAM-dependent methyltransferase [Nocardia yamanashiensis]
MPPAPLSGNAPELSALAGQLPALSAAESAALLEAARTYAATGLLLTDPATADPASWRTPLRLLLIDGALPGEAVQRDYDNWAHWIAGGGLLAIHGVTPGGNAPADQIYDRATVSGKYRELTAVESLRILQRTAACN